MVYSIFIPYCGKYSPYCSGSQTRGRDPFKGRQLSKKGRQIREDVKFDLNCRKHGKNQGFNI
jgi:hypothetical protein